MLNRIIANIRLNCLVCKFMTFMQLTFYTFILTKANSFFLFDMQIKSDVSSFAYSSNIPVGIGILCGINVVVSVNRGLHVDGI